MQKPKRHSIGEDVHRPQFREEKGKQREGGENEREGESGNERGRRGQTAKKRNVAGEAAGARAESGGGTHPWRDGTGDRDRLTLEGSYGGHG